MTSVKKTYVFTEVSNHNKTKDCWLIIHGKVYDVTPFMEDHPGGDEVLLAATGKDATADFEDIEHSDEAKRMMEKYYIGEVEESSVVPVKGSYVPAAAGGHKPYDQEKTSQFVFKMLQLMAPLFILGLTLAVRSYTKA